MATITLNLSPAALTLIQQTMASNTTFLCNNVHAIVRGIFKDNPTIKTIDDEIVTSYVDGHPDLKPLPLCEFLTIDSTMDAYDNLLRFNNSLSETPRFTTSAFSKVLFNALDEKLRVFDFSANSTIGARYGFLLRKYGQTHTYRTNARFSYPANIHSNSHEVSGGIDKFIQCPIMLSSQHKPDPNHVGKP